METCRWAEVIGDFFDHRKQCMRCDKTEFVNALTNTAEGNDFKSIYDISKKLEYGCKPFNARVKALRKSWKACKNTSKAWLMERTLVSTLDSPICTTSTTYGSFWNSGRSSPDFHWFRERFDNVDKVLEANSGETKSYYQNDIQWHKISLATQRSNIKIPLMSSKVRFARFHLDANLI